MKKAAFLIVALFLVLAVALPAREADAAASGLGQSQVCNGGKADVTYTWSATAQQVWLDISTMNNSWKAGTFISAGPFDTKTTSYTWTGLAPGKQHYFRINQQLATGRWEGSATAPFFTSCGDPSASGATPDEIRYRNEATAQVYAFAVKVKQDIKTNQSYYQMFGDFARALQNLEPVPSRFQDAHDELVGAAGAVDDYIQNPPGGKYVNKDFQALLGSLADALDDYALVVGINIPR
jgi:hypothetical protein